MSIGGEGGEAVDLLEDAQVKPGGGNVLKATESLGPLKKVSSRNTGFVTNPGISDFEEIGRLTIFRQN